MNINKFQPHQDITYAKITVASPTQRTPFSSATLGRPNRTTEFKRRDPTIFAEV